MKACFKCGERKSLGEFYRHPETTDGRLGKCKDCTKRDVARRYVEARPLVAAYERQRFQDPERKRKVRAYMKRHEEKHPDRVRARRAIRAAVKAGLISPQPCRVCGTRSRTQAHHHDYSRPLDVEWLCFRHHREVGHGQTMTF